MQEPANLAEAIDLSNNPPEIKAYMRGRLVQLMGEDSNVAIRAIELFMTLGHDYANQNLAGVSVDVLLAADRRARSFLLNPPEDKATPLNLATAERTIELVAQEQARRNIADFCTYIDPEFQLTMHHRYLCGELQILFDGFVHFREHGEYPEGFEMDRLRHYVGLPPRHGKSELFTVKFIAFFLGHFPELNVILDSHTKALADDFSRKIRDIVRDSPRFRELFPAFSLNPDRQRVDDWRTTAGGGLLSVGSTQKIDGHGASLIVMDDPQSEQDAYSIEQLDAGWEWYVGALRTRLAPGGIILFPMTRRHPRDIAGRAIELMEENPDAERWRQTVIRAVAEADDVLGRPEGAALWPERFNERSLAALKANSEPKFLALFQQNPRGSDSKMFYKEKFVRTGVIAWEQKRKAWCFDLALTEEQTSDYTAWAQAVFNPQTGEIGFVYPYRGRHEWPEAKAKILELMDRYPQDEFVFDKRSFEIMAVQELKKERPSAKIQQVAMKGDKRERAQVLADRHMSGRVYVVGGDDYANQFLNEHDQFTGTRGAKDDFVDVTSVATHHFGLHNEFMMLVDRGNASAVRETMADVAARLGVR